MILLSLLGLFYSRRRTIENKSLYLKLMVGAISLPFIANTFGWIMSEMGRQPWIVQGLMQTSTAVSPNVSAGSILFSLITFSTVYAIISSSNGVLIRKNN